MAKHEPTALCVDVQEWKPVEIAKQVTISKWQPIEVTESEPVAQYQPDTLNIHVQERQSVKVTKPQSMEEQV